MLIDFQPLSWFTGKLTRREPFAVIKHSDASLYCMQGRSGGDCNGCDYTPELREGLLASLSYWGLKPILDRLEPNFYLGVQRIEDRDKEGYNVIAEAHDIRSRIWLDTGILAASLMDGKLYPFIEALRSLPRVVVVSNHRIRRIAEILRNEWFIETPESNTYAERERIYQAVAANEVYGPSVYLFSCGMAACAMIPVLHQRHSQSTFLDTGHIWDALLGSKLRHYLNNVSETTLRRNLQP